MTWLSILLLAGGTYALKATGPLVVGERQLPRPLARATELLPAALLAALIAVDVVGGDRRLVVDARLAGFVAAAVAARFRASFLVIVLVGCAATAVAHGL